MDKKKVKELIEQAEQLLDKSREDGFSGFQARVAAKNCLKEAKEELSKSDWVSVEDKFPPKNEIVQVCNDETPEDLVLAYRTRKENIKIVYPNNVALYSATHWKPIEKLEE